MMLERKVGALIGFGAVAIGACVSCTPTSTPTSLPSYDSLQTTYQAVDELIGCVDEAPHSSLVNNQDGWTSTSSIKCTDSVEVFHFDSEESKAETYSIFAEVEGTVRFAEGQNWFVVDYSEVATSGEALRPLDLAGLAEKLDAKYTEVQ